MSDNPNLTTAATVAAITEVTKNAYNDIAHPSLAATGKVIALIPQIIDRALLPVQKWVAEGQYKLAETKKLLEKKLENVSPENIVSPESHIAVPALQAISYSMDNEEIRDMYANLLTSSMHEKVKNDVHPAFVEIIKQLSPDEARILKYLYNNNKPEPMITLRLINKKDHSSIDVIRNFSLLFRQVPNLEQRDFNKISILLDNLVRQKIIEIHEGAYLTKSELYIPIENDNIILTQKRQVIPEDKEWKIQKTFFDLTFLGKSFCKICISDKVEPIGII